MTKLRNSVGERIRAIRKAKGLTQQQLAELSGLDDAYIGSVERGERNFSVDTLEKIIVGLNIPVSYLFYNQNEINEEEKARYEAIDQYTNIIIGLTSTQVTSMKKIVNELNQVFQK
ncbi:helix-turn-helix transcriptional regulator [Paenibacillus taichungensis]|uniref:helix-turn-helix domain-containing protein n=1 Tax=Paenibacillus taichungensis TaxID=484184 RepID=UPI002DB5C5CC|nr:helix-turn-helix transcriptional regulator [Paenibacillus taichungensis]MEC0109507.1 helix-turn-helix transcriptional regulator [Paenibacillus taichungensis]MEC0197455.1 helix-turn-helix transcriptional regulator [Paenibacillus taichungensis]